MPADRGRLHNVATLSATKPYDSFRDGPKFPLKCLTQNTALYPNYESHLPIVTSSEPRRQQGRAGVSVPGLKGYKLIRKSITNTRGLESRQGILIRGEGSQRLSGEIHYRHGIHATRTNITKALGVPYYIVKIRGLQQWKLVDTVVSLDIFVYRRSTSICTACALFS